jgi:hypothetical protein
MSEKGCQRRRESDKCRGQMDTAQGSKQDSSMFGLGKY